MIKKKKGTPAKPLYLLDKIVEITWVDSCANGGWDDLDSYKKRQTIGPMKSVGYLLDDTKNWVSVLQSQSIHKDGHNSICIPKVAILAMKEVKRCKK